MPQTNMLAQLASWKCAIHNLPFGGAKGTIKANPKLLTVGERERILRCYTHDLAMRGFCNPAYDVLSHDVGTSAEDCAKIVDTYKFHFGSRDINHMAVVTGKPVDALGISGRDAAGGRGAFHVLKKVLEVPEILKDS